MKFATRRRVAAFASVVVLLLGSGALAERAQGASRAPDLAVIRLAAPGQALSGNVFTVDAEIAELNGVSVSAKVTLSHATSVLGSASVKVKAGGRTRVSFQVTLQGAGPFELLLKISNASPAETNTTNNESRATVNVIEFQLAPAQVLVPTLEGYGTQYNHHVYAAISRAVGVTEENVKEMEAKVIALEPPFIRVFFHHSAFTDPDRMQSFVRTVQLAQQSGTTINVTWQGGGQLDPSGNMSKFANVLIDLVKNKGVTKLRWVTIHNEVNSTLITMEENEAMYRALDPHLRNAGVRDQIRFMGGDLVGTVSPLGETQEEWFQYLATKMADILDAYSVHILWDYWDTAKLVRRLQEVRAIVDGLPESGRKPVYVTEFSVRGIRNLDGVSYPAPGIYEDGTPMAQTNINAFQHAWFNVLAAKLRYYGTVKWDAYFGKYDAGTQAHYMIGPPQEGWPLRPVYHLTRLLTLTTKLGWKVVGVDGSSGSKLLAAYASPEGHLTVVGLDTAGAQLNTVSATQVSYNINGFPPNASFRLYYWNHDGSGQNVLAGVVTSNEAGVLNVSAPLHGVFAVTTLP